MLKDLKILGKESLIYGLSTVVARLLNFLLVPLYTHYLATGDYGIVATLFSYVAFMNIIYQYGMDQAYMRYEVMPREGHPEGENFSTSFITLTASSFALSLLIYFYAPLFARLGGIGEKYAVLVRYTAWILAFDTAVLLPFAHLRLKHKAWKFVTIRIVNIVSNVVLSVLLLSVFRLGVQGVFIATLASSAITFAFLLPDILSQLKPVFSYDLLKKLLRFGTPLVPAGLAAMMVQVIDRPILLWMTDAGTVGIYQANYRLGIFMMLVVSMFDQAWRPFYLEKSAQPHSGAMFGRVFTYFMLSGVWIVTGLSFFIGNIVRIPVFGTTLIHSSYWPGLPVAQIVLFGYLFYGAYINFMASIVLSRRTELLIHVTFLGAIVNVVANAFLIRSYGMIGAAWATFLAYFAMALCLYFVGRKIYTIPYEYRRLAHIAMSATFIWLTYYLAESRLGVAHAGYLIFIRAGLLALFPILLVATKFFGQDEIRHFMELFSRSKPQSNPIQP